MRKKYIVRLTLKEREHLSEVIKKLKGSGQKVCRAHLLLKADADGPSWTDEQIAQAFSCRIKTVKNLRQRFVERGFESTLEGKKREQPPTAKRRTRSENHCYTTPRLCQLELAFVG